MAVQGKGGGEMRAVYIVAALNFCIDALLLAGTALLAGRALHPARLLAASALGAAYAGACLLPQLHALAGLPGRLTCLGLMAMAAYGPDGKTGGAFILLTMALGGAALAVAGESCGSCR